MKGGDSLNERGSVERLARCVKESVGGTGRGVARVVELKGEGEEEGKGRKESRRLKGEREGGEEEKNDRLVVQNLIAEQTFMPSFSLNFSCLEESWDYNVGYSV